MLLKRVLKIQIIFRNTCSLYCVDLGAYHIYSAALCQRHRLYKIFNPTPLLLLLYRFLKKLVLDYKMTYVTVKR